MGTAGRPRSLAEIVRTHAAERPHRTVLIDDSRVVTWSELHRAACRVANALAASGVRRGDRVAFLDVNSIEHFEVMFGAALLGAISVDVNWRLAPPEVAGVVTDSAAVVLIAGEDYEPLLDEIANVLPATVVIVNGSGRHTVYAKWTAAADDSDPGATVGPEDVALQIYTSGTTGRPKGVLLSNASWFTLAPRLAERWELDHDSVVLIALPLFHIGAGGWATIALWAGGALVIKRGPVPDEIVASIERHGVTHTVLVPATIQTLIDIVTERGAEVASLRVIGYGGAPISPTLLARTIDTFHCKLWQGYGLTETGGPVTMLAPEDHPRDGAHSERLRSAGKLVEGAEMRIVAPTTGTDVHRGDVGEIWVRGDYLMAGYANQPDATAEVMVDGWFRTGDAGYLDADGYLYLHDRIKDMIVSGGENIYPGEVENALAAHPAVLEAAVIGVPHETWGETPKALVVRRPGATVTADDIARHCRAVLAGYKCPTSIDFVDALPRNPTGKVLKSQLSEPYWRGRGRFVS